MPTPKKTVTPADVSGTKTTKKPKVIVEVTQGEEAPVTTKAPRKAKAIKPAIEFAETEEVIKTPRAPSKRKTAVPSAEDPVNSEHTPTEETNDNSALDEPIDVSSIVLDLTQEDVTSIRTMYALNNIGVNHLPNRDEVYAKLASFEYKQPMYINEDDFVQVTARSNSGKVRVFMKSEMAEHAEEIEGYKLTEFKLTVDERKARSEAIRHNEQMLSEILAVMKKVIPVDAVDAKLIFFIFSEESRRAFKQKNYKVTAQSLLKRFLNYKYFQFRYSY